jgi:hypothetical protein
MIELLLPIELNKYDTSMILPVKCYIDNFMRLWNCIRNVNTLQNPPPIQPLAHYSLLHLSSPKSPPHTTTSSPKNPPTEQALQHHSPPCVHSPKSPLILTRPLLLFKIHRLHKLFSLNLHHIFLLQSLLLILTPPPQNPPKTSKKQNATHTTPPSPQNPLNLWRSRMPMWMNRTLIFRPQWGIFLVVLKIINTINCWRTCLFQVWL